MYKVDPKDEIARFRTPDQAGIDDALAGGFIGADPKDEAIITKYADKLITTLNAGKSFMQVIGLAHKLADLFSKTSAKNSVCQKGCSHCCRILVSVSKMEAAYIAKKTGRTLIEDRSLGLSPTDDNIEYCPFHDDETAGCSIYSARPISCRIFFAFDDPSYCADPNTTHAISTDNGKSPIKFVQDMITWLVQGSGNQAGDIRDYFDATDSTTRGNKKKVRRKK